MLFDELKLLDGLRIRSHVNCRIQNYVESSGRLAWTGGVRGVKRNALSSDSCRSWSTASGNMRVGHKLPKIAH
jgi:hypothetical protein